MLLQELREAVYRANSMLAENGLVVLTWGNASGIDRESGLVAIKPSGLSYDDMRPQNLTIVTLDGKVVDGNPRPSSDTPTHLELYKAWPEIGGVAHTHSIYATSFAQACASIPCYGTTHADFCPGEIPCVRPLARLEVETNYEKNTGLAIVEQYDESAIDPLEYPGAVLAHHGPFTWGKDPVAAADHALILENIAKMALNSRIINSGMRSIPEYLVQKHFLRKHGANAYYGQN